VAQRIFDGLHRASLLKDLSAPEFANATALLLVSINTLHPFREGNGRTQRLFLSQLALTAGHSLEFTVITRARMIQASIESMKAAPRKMIRLIEEAVDTDRHAPLQKVIRFLQEHGPAAKLDWNDLYISSATPGQVYTGKLIGMSGGNFLMRRDDDSIVVGNAPELPGPMVSGQAFTYTAKHPLRAPADRVNVQAPKRKQGFEV
jgi:cell filamentation protein